MKWAIFFCIICMAPTLSAQKLVSFLSATPAPETLPSEVKPTFAEIPFDLLNGMIIVEASVDGQNASFILDTGAPMLILNREKTGREKEEMANSCSGEFTVGTTTIRHFTWGGIEKENVEILTVDLSHLQKAIGRPIEGLIGFQIFEDRELYIDFPRRRILVLNPQKNILHRAATPLETSRFFLHQHLPVLQLQIGRQTFDFGIDTGSETNLIDHCAIAKIDTALFDTLKTEEIQGLDQKIKIVPVLQMNETILGNLSIKSQPYLATELCHLKSEQGDRIDGLLGYDFFNHLKISINYTKKEIYFWSLRASM